MNLQAWTLAKSCLSREDQSFKQLRIIASESELLPLMANKILQISPSPPPLPSPSTHQKKIKTTVISAKTYTIDGHQWTLRWCCRPEIPIHMTDVNWQRHSPHYRNLPALIRIASLIKSYYNNSETHMIEYRQLLDSIDSMAFHQM